MTAGGTATPLDPVREPGPDPAREAHRAAVRAGYTFDEPAVELGVLADGDRPVPDARIRLPLAMLNRHGLVCGATGSGKTVTLQVLAEQLSAAGVPVFAADIKGDLSGLVTPGTGSEKLLARTRANGQDWTPAASPVEFFALGTGGLGVPVRATATSFGPLLLAKVLGLNDTQESSLSLVFHWADQRGLPMVDLTDLRAVLHFLTEGDGKVELRELGGVSTATVGVILRAVTTLQAQGADAFFGEPELELADLCRTTTDGAGIISLLELPDLHDRPALFSTFLMWLLAELFETLPEVGDAERPRLVFFFDEAHLLFADASRAFLSSVAQTVRLIRSKGVGIVFVTQSPQDVPEQVLAQLGARVQHQVRAHTPKEARALRQTVSTFPQGPDDLAEVLQTLGTGEAVVTVLGSDGAPTPVARTRVFAPRSTMGPTPAEVLRPGIAVSPLMQRYGQAVDRDSAREMLARRVEEQTPAPAAPPPRRTGRAERAEEDGPRRDPAP
ncbi:helicase HerA-like domain-containing protein, partial [Desertihabitans aurantiacus]|uniref:helicase HerA-like domain-containing protein n=1 Tax=Desertihabitans aurantiacus TaxID=2282477 RepID=UPI000DF7D3CD